MILVKVNGYDLIAKPIHSITSGTAGRMVSFEFSPEWEDLVKTAVFKGSGEARDVALLASDTCTLPLDVLEEHGGDLLIGVYGRNAAGTVVMPTVWGRIEYIREGAALSEADPSEPAPDWTAQVQAAAAAALEKAKAVETAAGRGDFDGADGTTFTPSVSSDGTLSWSNDGGKQNPASVNIRGPEGIPGSDGAPGADGQDGVSPAVTVAEITGGHRVTITDADHPQGQSFDVTDGATGATGGTGPQGPSGKSAYEAAAEGGYTGTEAEFNAALAEIDTALQPSDVDAELSDSSENPVQNKVVTEALSQKADTNAVYSKEAVNARDDALYAAILTGGGDYKATMRSFFLANSALLLTDLTELCDRWYNLSRTGWTGGVRFNQPQEGVTMSSDGTKTGDNAGLSCTPSTVTEANRDDYAALPLFAVVDCNVTLDEDGKPHVTAIDGIPGSFQRNDPTKIVCCMQQTGWMRFVEDADVFGFDYTDQEADGFAPLPEAVELTDNSVRSWVVHCKYGAGDAWGSCSGVPLRVWDVSHNNARTQVRAAWGNRYCAATSADDAFLKIMLYLKYAQLDSDRILHGCVNYNYTYQLALGETGVERVLLTPAQAATLLVGSCVCVGTANARNGTKSTQVALLDRVRITSIETVEIDGVSYGAVYVDNGGVTFDSATTYYLYTYQWYTGSTDDVLGNDGGINPLNDRFPVKLQGIEILSGCYEVVGDVILRYEESGGVQCEVAHVCRDASKIATSVTVDYKTCAYGFPCPASSGWQYPKRLGHDPALPEVMLGSVSGASSTSGTRDGFYIEKYAANAVREWRRWCSLSTSLGYAGLSCGYGNDGLGGAYWHIGGRLSVTGNRGEYQAAA